MRIYSIEFIIRAYFSIPDDYPIISPTECFNFMIKEIFDTVELNFNNFLTPRNPNGP